MDRLVYWIWLSLACTPDTPTFARLLGAYDDAEEVYNADDVSIRRCVGHKVSDCTNLINKDLTEAKRIYDFCTSKGVGILTYDDEKFPESLRNIQTPPVLLYYRGQLPDFTSTFRCAVVGTRRLSDCGRRNAFTFGHDIALAGGIVVSGMAIGIDGVALAGALSVGATTIAVLGSGIDVCYPPVHQRLAQEIVKRGCVFTEYAPGTKPLKYNFPRRNRLISGLSDVTVVVEGNENSGAIITARCARKQGRPIYAFPGSVGLENSQATNILLKNGAKVCTDAGDVILDYYEKEVPPRLNPFNVPRKLTVRMNDVLCEYKVSCVAPGDNIFTPSGSRVRMSNQTEPTESAGGAIARRTKGAQAEPERTVTESTEPPCDFNKDQIIIYQRIPVDSDCTIESLVTDEYDLKKVMGILLKLEMRRFVVLLPGDKVKRIK